MIYISGGITGDPDYESHFGNAERMLSNNGEDVVNPARILQDMPSGLSWARYMDVALDLLRLCDSVYMLRGWEKSYGAQVEYYYAMGCGKPVFFEEREGE